MPNFYVRDQSICPPQIRQGLHKVSFKVRYEPLCLFYVKGGTLNNLLFGNEIAKVSFVSTIKKMRTQRTIESLRISKVGP